MEKIWFDTDIGSDIDDAVALAYLLTKPECELVGITTVSGDTVERAKIADAICKAAGKKTPIYPGIEKPLLTEPRQSTVPQAKKLPNWEHDKEFPQNQALEAMCGAIEKHPGEITLLGTGPMTNLALLFSAYPHIPGLLKGVTLMCGEFLRQTPMWDGSPEAEWNSYCDPYAAAIVYNTPVSLFSIGLDVTMKVRMSPKQVREKFTTLVLCTAYDFAQAWFEDRTVITFHDPLAAASIFKPELMQYRRGNIKVELKSDAALGRTYFKEDNKGLHTIGTDVNTEAFFDEYFLNQK